ncbi:hypothetical protein NW762_001325 [Fusarium torreyae]|uniref:Uncharacterized protein n=1 Tax=Fusarium torreyae TaxID=1237075 RepID=A0A9W8SFG7_9HYPO|nr:hypothetical protein NW762_001325 [Fusarium torreyae]
MPKTIFRLFLGFSLVVLVTSQTTSLDSESICGYIDGGELAKDTILIHTVECTDGSLSACATYTWPELSAEGYFCAPSQTTATVITAIDVSTSDQAEASSQQPTTADEEPTEPLPTIDESRPPEEPRPTETQDTGPPDLGTEHESLDVADDRDDGLVKQAHNKFPRF